MEAGLNYQNILCLGDSQTFGARTYGCYPLYLAESLTSKTPYCWRAINRSVNGYTARDLWFMLNVEIDTLSDVFQCCLLIGTNDVGNVTPVHLFKEYYRQIIRTLCIKNFKAVYCGEIPPIHPDGHVFFDKESARRREIYNEAIQQVVGENTTAIWVPLPGLDREAYEDPVHFNETGNQRVAVAFAEAIVRR
jgi:lysophospholipase L1-like esterase